MERVFFNLQKFGLTEYEAKAYTTLVKLGITTAKEIARHSGIPYSTIHHVLNSLESKGWIIISKTRPTRYSANPPTEAIGKALTSKQKELQDSASFLESQLTPLYKTQSELEKMSYWLIKGKQACLAKLRERAEHSSEIVIHFRTYPQEKFIDLIRSKIPSGKQVYFIFRDTISDELKNHIRKLFPSSHALFLGREPDIETEVLFFFDNRELLELHSYPSEFGGIWVHFPPGEETGRDEFIKHAKKLW